MQTPEIEYGARQLRRLEFLTDVVFGLGIMRLFLLLPRPEGGLRSVHSFTELYKDSGGSVLMVIIGVAWLIVFWVQHNRVFGMLQRTDTRHTVISMLQICAMLIFLYAVRLGVDFDGQVSAMLFESIAAAVMGALAIAGWLYASKGHRLTEEAVTDEHIRSMTASLLNEPLTAVCTIGIAFFGPGWWTLSWIGFGVIVKRILRRWEAVARPEG